MSDLITWTTAEVTVQVEEADLSSSQCYVTISQRTKSGSLVSSVTEEATVVYDGTHSYVTASFTQAQTGTFTEGRAEVMVNAVDEDGTRPATDPMEIRVGRNLIEEELEWQA